MPYPRTTKGKKAASTAFAICSKVKDPTSHEKCVEKVYKDKKKSKN
jgi:hypothetical protein